MKKAPTRVTSVEQAVEAEVLRKPYIYYHEVLEFWCLVKSASSSRNIRARNFCIRRNQELYAQRKEAGNAKAPPLL